MSNAASYTKIVTEPRWCQLSQAVLLIVLFAFMSATFLLLVVTWTLNAGGAVDVLVDDVMAPQEWNVVRDKVIQIIDSASSIKQIVENRLNDEGLAAILWNLNLTVYKSHVIRIRKFISSIFYLCWTS